MNRKTSILLTLTAGILLSFSVVAPAETLKKTDGNVLTGVRIKWFETRREYQVEGADGSIIPVPEDDVDSLQITKPADFDKAVQAFTAKQYDVAIPILEDLVTKYNRLEWDAKSRELLANACFAKGDFKKAVQVMGDLIEKTPKSQITDEQYVIYWKALTGASMNAVLKTSLKEAIAGESKSLAALATIKRGDVYKSEGARDDAILDYLRVALMFGEAPEAHPEALYKAAQLLDEARDPRADDLRKKLVSMYPDSVYAKKLGGQM